MKITKKHLQDIIEEEIKQILAEDDINFDGSADIEADEARPEKPAVAAARPARDESWHRSNCSYSQRQRALLTRLNEKYPNRDTNPRQTQAYNRAHKQIVPEDCSRVPVSKSQK